MNAIMIKVLLVLGLAFSDSASSQEALRIRLADVDKAKIALLVTNEADTTGYLQIDASIADSLVSIEQHLGIEPKATLRVSFSELSVPADAQEIVATVEVGSKLNIIAPMVSLIPDDDILYKEVVLEKQLSSKAANVCPAAGMYCGWELGGSSTDKNLFKCSAKDKTPVLFHGCREYCAGATKNPYKDSFCAVTAKMPASDLGVFANANLAGTELLWADKTVNSVTYFGGNRLRDAYKFAQTCTDNKALQCTNAGGECAAFAQFQTGAPLTSKWAPLTSAQLSVANAPNGTVIGNFVNRTYQGHTMMKCGTMFCDANWAYDMHVRKHAVSNTAGYSVVAIPSTDGY